MQLRRRLGQGLLSLAIATVAWLMVHNLDRLSATFQVPLTYAHPQTVLKLPGYPQSVEVSVLATKPKLRTLSSADFSVIVDNRAGRLGPQTVVLDADEVSAPFGVVVKEVSPSQFTVTYDAALKRLVPVAVDLSGSPAEGHEVAPDGVVAKPAQVAVVGPESRFTPDMKLRTEKVALDGRDESFTAAHVQVLPPSSDLMLADTTHVEVSVRIQTRMSRVTLEDVPVMVDHGPWRTSPPNPRTVKVTVEGPEPSLKGLVPSDVQVVLDADALTPQDDDYQLEPLISLPAEACPGCRIVALSQKRVHLTVKPARHRGGREAWELRGNVEAN